MTRTQPSNEDSRNDLGKSEKRTLDLYHKGYTTSNAIAEKRGLSPSTIRNHLANLRRKGYIGSVPGHQTDVPPLMAPDSSNKKYRLHGEEYNVQIINSSVTYRRAFKRGSDVVIDGNRVRLYRDSFEVYSGHDFWGDTEIVCERQSSRYWQRFFLRLESTFNILIVKPGRHNVKRVKVHVAEVGNELAEGANAERERIRVSGRDGKEWLVADASYGFDELETTHPERAVQDMGNVVRPFFNDLRTNSDRVRLPSELSDDMNDLRKYLLAATQGLKASVDQQNANAKVLGALVSSQSALNDTVAAILKMINPEPATDELDGVDRPDPDYFG